MKPAQDKPNGNDTLARLRGYFPSLSPSEKKVGIYVLENYEKIIRMTLAEIADQAGVSDATAVRFCHSLGYEGWLEFKIELTQTLPRSPLLIHKDFSDGDAPEAIARKVIRDSVQALENTLAVLTDASFNKAVEMLAAAQKILIVGVGTSGPMVQEMFNRLFRLGLNCQMQTDSYLQVMQVALLSKDDLLVVISQTGDSYDPRRTAYEAKRAGIPVLCITGNALSQVTRYADVILLSASEESMPETLSSRIAQYALIHALYMSLAMRSTDQTIDHERIIWETLMRKKLFQDG